MKKRLVIISVVVLILCAIYTVIESQQPVVLDEAYINSDVLLGTEYVNEILFLNEMDNYVACLCAVEDEELMLLILENTESYDMHFRHSFSLSELTRDPYTVMTDDVLFTDSKISYNVFLDPDATVVQIQDKSVNVNVVSYSTDKAEYKIGFWCFE